MAERRMISHCLPAGRAPTGLALPAALACLVVCGCSDPGGSTNVVAPSEVNQKAQREEIGRQLLASGSDMLNGLDHFVEGGSDFRETNTEEAIKQTVRRLNEGLALVSGEDAESNLLSADDGKILREIVWLRDASRFAVGDATDPLLRAQRLFDWTIRNIQLIPDDASADEQLPLLPWHALIFGRGTALDRAWIFQLLARQQGLDVVLLAYPDTQDTAQPHWWCPALVQAKADAAPAAESYELYLFEPRWGTPIPGPAGKSVATLAQVCGDDGLLRALDIDAEHAYPVRAAEIQKLVALVETSTPYLSPRFTRLEAALAGEDKLVLSVDRAALAAKLAKIPHIEAIRDWPLREARYAASREKSVYEALSKLLRPFNRRPTNLETGRKVGMPPLWRARVRHISGKYYENMAETDAELRKVAINRWYQEARPAEADLEVLRLDAVNWEYLHRMKQHATYWLGLTSFDLGKLDTSATFFELVLREEANGGWTSGARYNLGRTYEAEAAATTGAAARSVWLTKAAATYRATYLKVPPDAQCLWRAKQIEAQLAKKK